MAAKSIKIPSKLFFQRRGLTITAAVLLITLFGFLTFLCVESIQQNTKVLIDEKDTIDSRNLQESLDSIPSQEPQESEPQVPQEPQEPQEESEQPQEEPQKPQEDTQDPQNPQEPIGSSSIVNLESISDARIYFEGKKEVNSLLVSVEWSETYISLTFENTDEEVRLNLSTVSTFQLNKENWLAYVTYTDDTEQTIHYLGDSINVDNSSVVLGPHPLAPMSAKLTFKTKVPGRVKLTIKGRDAESHDLVHQFKDQTTKHQIPLLGLYSDYNNEVTVTFTDPKGNKRVSSTFNLQVTTKLGAIVSKIPCTIKEKSTYDKPLFILIAGIVFDEQCYVRWHGTNLSPRYPLSGGIWGDTTGSGYLSNWMGEALLAFKTQFVTHHEISEKTPGGNIIAGGHTSKNQFDLDAVIEIDRTTGEQVKSWDLRNYFDKTRAIRESYVPQPANDWFHLNGAIYDPKDNTLLLSGRNQCAFTKIGYDDGEVKYIAAAHDDWVAPYTNYLLTPINFNTTLHENQDWTYFQHSPQILPNGNVLIYDNGAMRAGFTNNPAEDIFNLTGNYYMDKYFSIPSGYTRAVEYKVDTNDMTITKVWEYTDFPTLMTAIVGSVRAIDTNTILIGYGEIGAVSLVDKANNKTLWRIQLKEKKYRAYPVNFYEAY